MVLLLDDIVQDFATALLAVDARKPEKVTKQGRSYGVGVGPHEETEVVRMTLAEMKRQCPERYSACGQELEYAGTQQHCDVWIGEPLQHVIEIKMARLWHANGNADDTAIKDVLSPYPDDHSALTDCLKLATSSFECSKSVLIYGFEKPGANKPLEPLWAAFETLARQRVDLGVRVQASLPALSHPVHASGFVCAWTITRGGRTSSER